MKPLPRYHLEANVRLRRTRRGGAVFLPGAARTIELDEEGFAVVSLLDAPHSARELRSLLAGRIGRNCTVAEIDILLRELVRLGAVRMIEGSHQDENAGSSASAPASVPGGETPAPESIHLQLNNVCNLRCPSCYVGLQSEDVGSLPVDRLFELIDEWAEMGVFQLALGGGEPLMSPKLEPVARRARARGMVPNVTTNGWLITPALLDDLAGSVGELRLSLNDTVSVDRPLLEDRAALLRSRDVRFGFNLIVTRRNLERLPEWLRWARSQGAATINLIRPKPAPGNDGWYARNALEPADTLRIGPLLEELEPLLAGSTLTVDCAFSFLFHGRPVEELLWLGVEGCPIGDRFAVVAWNGDVYPCSHLRGEEFRAGNVASASFREIWERGVVFARLRGELDSVEGHCGTCGHFAFCRGCRAVMRERADNWLSADDECGHAPGGRSAPPNAAAPAQRLVTLAPARHDPR